MTTELEKQFFDTFGIEPEPIYSELWADELVKYEYPQITDRILLELICILNNTLGFNTDIEKLKTKTLNYCLSTFYKKGIINDYFKQQVQALFKE